MLDETLAEVIEEDTMEIEPVKTSGKNKATRGELGTSTRMGTRKRTKTPKEATESTGNKHKRKSGSSKRKRRHPVLEEIEPDS